MDQPDYTYIFSDIENSPCLVKTVNHRKNRQEWARLAIHDRELTPAVGQIVPPQVADLVDLAVAVYAADRLSNRRGERPCYLHLVLPVRHPEVLGNPHILELLQEILYWYTDDHWFFTFTQRNALGRLNERQLRMPLAPKDETALWSGGLDSLAGLCNRLVREPGKSYMLLGTGSSTFIHSVQQKAAADLRRSLPTPRSIELVRVPIDLCNPNAKHRNRNSRARAFVFLALGAACAFLQEQTVLHIYENGIGAINLPFRASEVGLDHARSVHPLSLLKMGKFLSLTLGHSFSLCNPFQFWTKAQMCRVLVETEMTHLVPHTISCDRRRRSKIKQCGWCSSCLLRRQALAASGITDSTKYWATSQNVSRTVNDSHLRAMLHQVAGLRQHFCASDPWQEMVVQYPVLQDIIDLTAEQEDLAPEDMAENLLQMYKRYTMEWDSVWHYGGADSLAASFQLPN